MLLDRLRRHLHQGTATMEARRCASGGIFLDCLEAAGAAWSAFSWDSSFVGGSRSCKVKSLSRAVKLRFRAYITNVQHFLQVPASLTRSRRML